MFFQFKFCFKNDVKNILCLLSLSKKVRKCHSDAKHVLLDSKWFNVTYKYFLTGVLNIYAEQNFICPVRTTSCFQRLLGGIVAQIRAVVLNLCLLGALMVILYFWNIGFYDPKVDRDPPVENHWIRVHRKPLNGITMSQTKIDNTKRLIKFNGYFDNVM